MLVGENAKQSDIYQPWELDNQAWWDWYITLAENKPEEFSYQEEINNLNTGKQLSLKNLKAELSKPFNLKKADYDFFLKNGFIKIKNILSNDSIFTLHRELSKIIMSEFSEKRIKEANFLSMDLIWLNNKIVKEFVLSKRIAKIAAQLLNVPTIRLYHDNILSKQPGCGRTPWHYDIHHFPLDTKDVVTVWIPAQPISMQMGPLSFAKPLDAYKHVEKIKFNKFNKNYDKKVSDLFKEKKIEIESSAFEVGEISFHHNLCFHNAPPNNTTRSRIVLANTFFKDGTKVVKNPTMVSGDWKKFIPNTDPGGLINSPLNPICWPEESLDV
ncbi:MAG: snoK [Rickettsiales bacterium]|nr:snoK [Rickettsiales bacterium]OUW02923.1 MAG: snoK [Betaproteobacteria bacterium TMED156]